jgi:hypothetical protein
MNARLKCRAGNGLGQVQAAPLCSLPLALPPALPPALPSVPTCISGIKALATLALCMHTHTSFPARPSAPGAVGMTKAIPGV